MNKRPTSITVIAWILIVTAGISLVVNLAMIGNATVKELMAKSPLPMSVQYAVVYLGLFVTLVSGYFMLRGKGWARALYVGWGIVGLVIGLTTSPMKTMLIPGVIFFGVLVFFLFRPAANAFFSPKRDAGQNI